LRIYTQAHHLELEFYDKYFGPGSYLQTHAEHMARWHVNSRRLYHMIFPSLQA